MFKVNEYDEELKNDENKPLKPEASQKYDRYSLALWHMQTSSDFPTEETPPRRS